MSTTQVEGCPTKRPTLLNPGLDSIRNLGFLTKPFFRVVADIKSQKSEPVSRFSYRYCISACVRRSWGVIRVLRFVDYGSGVTC